MKALRSALAAAVVAICALAAVRIVIPKWTCNAQKSRVLADTQNRLLDPVRRAPELMAICRRCLERFPHDYEYAYMLAGNEHWLGRREEAEKTYRRSLDLNERPDGYAQLALIALERGDLESARRHLTTASLFDITFSSVVGEPLRNEVQTVVHERAARLRGEPYTPPPR